jgi:putative DNA primase/helicase
MDRQQATAKLAELRKRAGKKNASAKKSNGDAKVDAEIARLAALSPVQYEQQRKDAAEKLGLRASILDKLVKAERPDDGNTQGSAIEFPEPEPWPEPINGARLLDDVADAIRNHVVLADAARDTAALWVIHAYLLDQFLVTPRLAITSPEKRCGKTTLLDVLGRLVLKALPAAHVTAAAMFRTIEACRPTLLIDEADTFLKGRNASDELRGIINSGHRKGGFVLRTVGDDHEPRAFATYAGCAIALIGRLPETVHDRSVVVSLKRRLPSEAIASFRPDRAGHLDVLARKAARWAADNADRIGDADPEMPEGIFNREADNWRPLLAIANAAGDDWPERASEALKAAHTTEDDESRLAMLLADIKGAFEEMKADRLASSSLVATLVAIEGRPWAEYGKKGKPMTQNQLARALKPIGIIPENIRLGDKVPKGYLLARFDDAFARYLSEGTFKPLHRYNVDDTDTFGGFQTATPEIDVADQKYEKSNNDGLCSGVAVQKGEEGVCAHCDAPEHPAKPFPDDGGDETGLSWRTIDRLANEVEEWAYANRDKIRTDQASVIEAEIRRRVISAGVLPEIVAFETERVMTSLFEGREAAGALSDGKKQSCQKQC